MFLKLAYLLSKLRLAQVNNIRFDLFPSFSWRCFLKEIENMSSVFSIEL